MTSKSGVAQNVISLPKGGGAVKGIGETFQPNLFSGTGNHSIPIALSPGRNGFGPSLSIQYSSGNGNGPFGLGWQLSIPRISRKTEKGLPRYDDTDVFVMSGAEDLVPCLKKVVDPGSGQDTWVSEDPIDRPLHSVYRYRPRTEGLFARIERWQHKTTSEVHWRAITRDNMTSIYGGTPASRVADPENERRVYEWLLQETFDATGNHILYEYARDNPQLYTNEALGLDAIFDRNREATQLYVRRIFYGNLPEPLIDAQGNPVTYADGTAVGHLRDGRRYAFELVFDYGDWDTPTILPHPGPLPAGQQELFGSDPSTSAEHHPVPIRDDRFSHFRAGFEIRTLRRCRRVLMFHHFAELGGPTLVRSTDFDYRNDPDTLLSFLTAVTVTGYRKDAAGTYQSASMPSVTFQYSEFRPHEQRYQSLAAAGNDMPPLALNDPNVTLVDLFGDGLPDVLHSSPGGFRYWRNLGSGMLDRPRSLPQIPAGIALGQPGVGFGDMGGDGQVDLLVHSGPLPGFFETTSDGTWQTFKPYEVFPSFDLQDPNVRLVDLTGDGRSDALMTRAEQFLWFECLGEKGFAPPQFIPRQHDLDQFPDVFFEDPAGRVRLADMTGDGLNDIVLVHNGRIDYWANLGYGRFGKRITMENAPHLEVNFDPKRLFLADLNGTGCADLVYVDFGRVHFWFNQSGNRWSEQQTILGTPTVTDVDSLQFADVFGTGTATLLWSYDYAAQPEGHYKALDFCGGVKPYVLTEMSNNMGATTRVSYAPSTHYFLEHQANGTPWITKLPFPVQVVDKVEVIDHISKTKLVTTYKYHHGYFDGREREFRGFGRVDQFDTETFEDFSQSSLHGHGVSFINNASAYHVPPVETRSWFHTGIYFDENPSASATHPFDYRELTNEFRQESYQGDDQAVPLDEHEVETGETPQEAYRALRGALLRTEVYAHDGSAKAEHPYQVTESRYRITQLQPQDGNHRAVYFSHQLESLTYHYERNPSDPRISHALTLAVDEFGNVLKSAAVGYGRRQLGLTLSPEDQAKQTEIHITYTENGVTNAIEATDDYRTPLPCESRTYELTGLTLPAGQSRFTLAEMLTAGIGAASIAYEQSPTAGVLQKRLIEHVRTLYRPDDLGAARNDPLALLALGAVEPLALPGESYKLAFTPGLLDQVYARSGQKLLPANPADVLEGGGPDRGGYVDLDGDGHWWIPSGRMFFSPGSADTAAQELGHARTHFFLPHRYRDPFHTDPLSTETIVTYDDHKLLMLETRDPLGNTVRAQNDYRVLAPLLMTDPNGNRSEVAFDALGMVVATAVKGKLGQNLGDLLEDFDPDPPLAALQAFVADPQGQAASLLGKATTRIVYDLNRYPRSGQPPFAATLARETHFSDPGGPQAKIQVGFSYSDGFGREIQKKIQAERGDAPQRGPTVTLPSGDVQPGALVRDANGKPVQGDTPQRWVGSGRTVFNNKGKPVRQYEPFFSSTHLYEEEREMTDTGVSPILFYDPIERVVATLHPNHTWEKVVFDPWQQTTYDVNDTVTRNPKTDDDVKGFFTRLPDAEYLPTWHEARKNGQLGPNEQAAAEKAAVHADTPTIAHADSLGRTFLTIAHNRFERAGAIVEENYPTRVVLDIEGNQRKVIDAKDRIVMRYDYDIAGPEKDEDTATNRIHQASMEAGERWMLNDVAGNPIYAWDSRDHQFRTAYDPLRRPTDSFLREGTGAELLVGHTVYGESRPNPEASNLRGKVVRLFDQAGVVTTEDYDFKGNLLRSQRQLAELVDPQGTPIPVYKTTVDWSGDIQLETDIYTSRTRYDALNRPMEQIAPDLSVYRPGFNEANLLEKVDVHLRGAALATPFVTDIDYNAKGQRTLIDYGNGVRTTYEYDPLTFRLTRLTTTRPAGLNGLATQLFKDAGTVQDLNYTSDPAGNITRIADDALPRLFFANQQVDPVGLYTYDAVYRLIEAQGRESIGQSALQLGLPQATYRDYPYAGLGAQPFDPKAVRNYTDQYHYDEVGNFLHMIHRAQSGAWQRDYRYEEQSLLETGKLSNRLSGTVLHPNGTRPLAEIYTHDTHGNMTAMPHLSLMRWDFKDQLQATSRQVVNEGTPETTYYVYDAAGQRVRKVTERQNGTRKNERTYLGGFEVYREYGGGGTGVSLERESSHVMDDQQRIALVETRTQGNDGSPERLIRYQFGNHLGSASLEFDDQAQIISYEEYYPYGSTSYQAGRSRAEVSLKRYRYTGKERDEETGFSYHGARYYAPWLARWMSADPASLRDGVNLYGYTGCNPITFKDPTGTDRVCPESACHRPPEETRITTRGYDDGPLEFEFQPGKLTEGQLTMLANLAHGKFTDYESLLLDKENWVNPDYLYKGEKFTLGGFSVIVEQRGVAGRYGEPEIVGWSFTYTNNGNWLNVQSDRNGSILGDVRRSSESGPESMLFGPAEYLGYAQLGRAVIKKTAGKLFARESATAVSAGHPAGISMFGQRLNKQQARLLEQLPTAGSEAIVAKKTVSLKDLAALTAQTGDEFAMLTRGGSRMIIRGTPGRVPGLNVDRARELGAQGWRFSAHTHPGPTRLQLQSSVGDRNVLEAFGGKQSAILNSMGERGLFTPHGDDLSGWLP